MYRTWYKKMNFWIQAGCPRATLNHDNDDETLCEALETIYPLWSESATIIWKGIYIPLSYKYDLSVIIVDLIDILNNLILLENGRHEINWPSNSFSAIWTFYWGNKDNLEIDAKWEFLTGGIEILLSRHRKISLNKIEFIYEWKQIFFNVIKGLKKAGYDEESIPEMKKLIKLFNEIESFGILYKD